MGIFMPMKPNDETNNANKHNMLENPIWQETDKLAICKRWTRVYKETNPVKLRSELDLQLSTSNFKSGAPSPLIHAASLIFTTTKY